MVFVGAAGGGVLGVVGDYFEVDRGFVDGGAEPGAVNARDFARNSSPGEIRERKPRQRSARLGSSARGGSGRVRGERRLLSCADDGREGSDGSFDHGIVSARNRIAGDCVAARAVELGAGVGNRPIAREYHDFQCSESGGSHDGMVTLCIGAGSIVGRGWFAAEDFDESYQRRGFDVLVSDGFCPGDRCFAGIGAVACNAEREDMVAGGGAGIFVQPGEPGTPFCVCARRESIDHRAVGGVISGGEYSSGDSVFGRARDGERVDGDWVGAGCCGGNDKGKPKTPSERGIDRREMSTS